MIAIKLQRVGRRHQPSYRVVVAESRSKMIAPPIEDLGSYSPFTKAVNVKADRVTYWIAKGAQPTTTVHNLLVKNGIVQGATRKLAMPAKAAAAPAEEKPAPVEQEAAAEEGAPDAAAEEKAEA